jgi:predicted transposase YbfD/YdcC
MKPKAKRNYVNNKDLLAALIQYKKDVIEAKEKGSEIPLVPNYVAECLMLIANRLSSKPNFASYPFRQDMIMDGVENCLLYMHNFDENKYDNPFAYFTTIIWQAFVRRISREKKQLYIKYKNSQAMISSAGTYEGDEVRLHLSTDVEYINDFIRDFEEKLEKDKEKKR